MNTMQTPSIATIIALSPDHRAKLTLFESCGFNLFTFAAKLNLSSIDAAIFLSQQAIQAALAEFDILVDAFAQRAASFARLNLLQSLAATHAQTDEPIERRRLSTLLVRLTGSFRRTKNATPPPDPESPIPQPSSPITPTRAEPLSPTHPTQKAPRHASTNPLPTPHPSLTPSTTSSPATNILQALAATNSPATPAHPPLPNRADPTKARTATS